MYHYLHLVQVWNSVKRRKEILHLKGQQHNGKVTSMDTQGRSESERRIKCKGQGIVQNEIWQERQSESTSKGRGKHTREAKKEGFVSCTHGFSKMTTKRQEGQTDTFEAITGRMGSLW